MKRKFKKIVGGVLAATLLTTMSFGSFALENERIESESLSNDAVQERSIHGNFRMVGYLPFWKDVDVSKLPYDRLTHINYAFLLPREDGSIKDVENPERLKSIIETARKNGVKTLIAVGGWEDNGVELDPIFEKLASNDASRERLVSEVLKVVESYGLDGVDMDWEYPEPGESANNFYKLMKSFSEKLKPQGKLLTAAVSCGRTPDGVDLWAANAITQQVVDLVDWLNIMAYDGGDGERHSTYAFAKNSMDYWGNTRGFSKDKLVLGVPFYGRPSWKTYKQLVQEDPTAPTKDVVNGVWYNGIETIKQKTMLAKEKGSGLMIWEITQDTADKTSLLTAAAEVVGYTPVDPPIVDPVDPTPIVEPEEQIPAPPAIIPNEETVDTASGIRYRYTITEKNTSQYQIELVVSNIGTKEGWNCSAVPTYGIRFYTDSKYVSFNGGEKLRVLKGGYLAEISNWQKAMKPGEQVKMDIVLQKSGTNPKPYGFSLKLLRGDHIQPIKVSLPSSFIKNNCNLKFSELVEDEAKYYETSVMPCIDQLMMYKPTSKTQIRIGQAKSVFVNGASGVKMLVPSKYFAMGLGYAQEIFGINPHYMMALGTKENFAFGFNRTSGGNFTTPIQTSSGTWYWGMINHGDGPFQQEIGNFNEMVSFYPDYFAPNASHPEYVAAKPDITDERLLTATLCSANSVHMTRDFVSAIPSWRFNDFVKYAKDKNAETSLVTFIYNRGINSVNPKIFISERAANLNAEDVMVKNGYQGFADHVPQVMGMVAKMNEETQDIYDVELSQADIELFMKRIRPFYRSVSNISWQNMESDVMRAFGVLADKKGKNTVSFRYDFLTILRVMKAHLPEPQPAAAMGDNYMYQVINKN